MTQGFGITAVMCASCGVTMSLQPPPFVLTVEAVEEMATKVLADGHVQQKAICTDSKKLVYFVLAMASDGMYEPVAEEPKPLVQITGLNGKASVH